MDFYILQTIVKLWQESKLSCAVRWTKSHAPQRPLYELKDIIESQHMISLSYFNRCCESDMMKSKCI